MSPPGPLDASNICRLNDKSIKTGKSKASQSRASSIAVQGSKQQAKDRQEELSYYKVLFNTLQKENSQLKSLNAKLRNNHLGKSKSRKKNCRDDDNTMSRTQAQHLVSHIQDI